MASVCGDCGVRDRALCGSLDDSQLAAFAALGSKRTLARGESLAHDGGEALLCANIRSGVLKLASVTREGSESIVGLLYAGDFVGEPFRDRHGFDVVALTDTELCVFPRAAFERALADNRRMEQLLLARTLADLERARGWLVRVARASAAARVAGFLDDMAQRLAISDCRRDAGIAAGAQFELPLRRGEIADLLGLTIETVSRQMTRLRAAGVIDLPGGRGIIVVDPAALADAAEG